MPRVSHLPRSICRATETFVAVKESCCEKHVHGSTWNRDKLLTQGERRETSTQNLQRSNAARFSGFLYLVFRRLNAGGKLVVGRSWTVKSRLHENEIFKGEFCTYVSLKIVKTSSSSMPSSDSITEVVARIFSVKTHKKDWMKNAELFVFNLSYNYISTKTTTTKTKYQTSHGQNSYTSSFSEN